MKQFTYKAGYLAKFFGRWLLLSVITGALSGLLGTAFHVLVEVVTEARGEHPWLLWCAPLAGLVIATLYRVTKTEGIGTNAILDGVSDGKGLNPWLIPVIFVSTVLTHLVGGSVGREGAALQMGGDIGYQAAGWLKFSDHERRTATICGMAAFFSALFGTPVAATAFALMVINVGVVFYAAFVPALTSALVAYLISLLFGVEPTRFAVTVPAETAGLYLKSAVLGLACAAVSVIFYHVIHQAEHRLAHLLPNPWLRAALGGAAIVALSYLFGVGRYNGAGMGVISAAIEQGQALPWDWVCKLILTALTLAAGFKGGEVVPSFFVGATFGCVMGGLLGIPAGFAAAMGLAAVFCGATNCIIPTILLATELFGGQGIVCYAIVCGITFVCTGYGGLYSSQKNYTAKWASEYFASRPWAAKPWEGEKHEADDSVLH